MPMMITRYGLLAALASGAMLAACSKGKESATTDTASAAGAVAANDTANRAVGDSSNPANASNAGQWSPPNVLAFATAANNAEIAEGGLAERKATNPAVKAFARQMVTDHRAMLQEGKSFASKQNITPDTTAQVATDLRNTVKDQMTDLTQKKAGKDWDSDYIDKQIDAHKDVLSKLQDAEKSTTDPQLKAMLTKAIGKVQEHLTKAQDIKDNKLKS